MCSGVIGSALEEKIRLFLSASKGVVAGVLTYNEILHEASLLMTARPFSDVLKIAISHLSLKFECISRVKMIPRHKPHENS